MSLLKELIEKIAEKKVVAAEEVESGNPATLTARAGRKRAAQDELKRLTREYRNAVMRVAAFVIVSGEDSETFGKTAATKYGCQAFPAESLFTELSSRIDPAAYKGREASSSLFDVVGRVLENLGHEMDLASYPMLVFSSKYSGPVADSKALANLVKRAICEQVGAEMAAVYILNQAAANCMAEEYAGKTVPIVLYTQDPKLAKEIHANVMRLGPKASFLLARAGQCPGAIEIEDMSPETVLASLTTVKAALAGRGDTLQKITKSKTKKQTKPNEETAEGAAQ